MRVYKQKQYLVFDFEDGRNVKYDFATKTAIGIKGKPVKNLCSQLSEYSLEEIFDCCDDKQYAKFLRFIKSSEGTIFNIGTILDRVPRYANFEQIFSAGIDDIIEVGRYQATRFKFTINDIPKSLIKLCKTRNIKISEKFIYYYKLNPDAHYLAYNLDYLSLDDKDVWRVLNRDSWTGNFSYFNDLLDNYGYTAKALMLYIDQIKTFEALDVSYFMQELHDYAEMMKEISGKFDRYPRHFLTTHRIACRNYNRIKKEFSEKIFKSRIRKDYECSIGTYQFIYPKTTQEIKDEAVQQNNCVASYIQRVIDGDCHIMFLRKKDSPDESLVTIEIQNGQIVQARRRFNDPVTEKEQEVIDQWNKKQVKKKESAA